MKTIAITATSFLKSAKLREYAENNLKKFRLKFPLLEGTEDFSENRLLKELSDVDGAIVGKEKITKVVLENATNLKVIAKYGVGIDNIDQKKCFEKGIEIKVKPGVNADSVAELTIGFMISLLRNIAISDRNFHQGKWIKDGGKQLSGKTVAIIGCGEIGSRVARILKTFSCKILLCDIISKDQLALEVGGEIVSFDECIKSSDIVTVHVPLKDDTRNMFSKSVLSKFRKGSFFVNTSRGGVVDQEALINVLTYGPLAGAALDVFSQEPVEDNRLFSLNNLIATPHIGGNSIEAVWSMGTFAVDAINDFFQNNS